MNKTTIIPKELITMHRGEKYLHASVLVTKRIITKCFFGLKKNITYTDAASFSVYSPSSKPEDSRWYYSTDGEYAPEITEFIYAHFQNIEKQKYLGDVTKDWANVKEVII